MSATTLVWHQFRYDQKTFWRNPAAVFFAVILPVMFLFIFVTIFGNETVELPGGGEIKGSTYYLPAIVTLGLVSTTFTNLAISLTASRERGLLKRVRKTPLPAWAFMAGRFATAIVATILLVAVLVGLGWLVYDVAIPTSTMGAALLTLVVGVLAFSALAFALSSAIPSENAAAPITNAIVLPLYFISGIFVPDELIPNGVRSVAELFPVKNLYEAFLTAFDPATSGAGFQARELAIVAAWGLAGGVLALRTFRWSPRSG
jgi:ABC-2 type transport system permease protein